jgi:hypothetical protein
MKRLKVFLALLAVVFSVSSAFSYKAKFTQQLYSYIGTGHRTIAANWTQVNSDAGCGATSGTSCTIRATQAGTTTKPTQASIDFLSAKSSTFTAQYQTTSDPLYVTVHQ